jgi:drug/metabolite transporter (DMT)-like permease
MNEQTRAYVILLFMPLLFSSNLVLGRSALEVVEPWTLAFWRWALACLILLPIAWSGIRLYSVDLVSEWKLIAVLGFLGMVVCGGGVFASLKHTTATNGTLIYTTSPVFVLILEVLFRGQRATLRQMIGIPLAFVGVAVILMRGELERLLGLKFNIGDLGIAAAAFSWAVYSVVLKRPALRRLPTMPLFATIAIAGTLLLLPLMIVETAVVAPVPVSARAWTSMVGLAIFSSILPFLAYQYGVKVVGPAVTSVFLYLLPLYGVVMAVTFLGEEFHAYHAAGFVLIMAGVVMATAPLGRKAQTAGAT